MGFALPARHAFQSSSTRLPALLVAATFGLCVVAAASLMGRGLLPAGMLPHAIDKVPICWASTASPAGATRPKTTVTQIGSEAFGRDSRQRITTVLVDFPPNAFTAEHHHEADVYVHVLKGTVRSQLAGQPAETYAQGQSFFEPEGSVHLFAENPSLTEPAQILVVYVHKDGARLTVFH